MEGKINTVLGSIAPADAGVVLPHEHLVCDIGPIMLKSDSEYGKQPVSPKIGWWLTYNAYSNYDNARLYEEKEAVTEELKFFKQNGGGLIVDNTTYGLQPDVKELVKMSRATGVHIVAGTGYYVECSRPSTVNGTVEEFYNFMENGLHTGCEGTGIKAGVLGELGCSYPYTESEKRVLQAAATLECDTGCPVIIHPGRNSTSPFDIMRIYLEAGGHASRVVMSHIDRTISEIPELLDFASKFDCYTEYDLFGLETSYNPENPSFDIPSDAQRIQGIKALVDNGFQDRITASQDMHSKHRLMKYGGHGYSHILLHAAPKMLERGISQENVNKILKDNPQRWLTFTKTNN